MCAQYVKQGDIFGRIGTGFGKGLAEQVPKEIERNRLQKSLQNVSDQEGLTPFQRFAGLVGAAHEYPQVVQSGSELLRQQAIRNSFRPKTGNVPEVQPGIQPAPMEQRGEPVGIPNIPADKVSRQVVQGGEKIPTDFQNRAEEAASNQGIVKENPVQNKFIPTVPWTPEQSYDNLGRLAERHPELTFEQLQQLNADAERRYLEAPQAYREQQDYLKGLEDEADTEFDKQLETTLQKEGKDVYQDLTGETLLDIKKAMRHDLATNPNLTPKVAAEKWVKKGRDFVDTKKQVKTLANRDIWDSIAPNKKESTLKALKQAQKSYDEMGRKREFYNMLRTNNSADSYGFGLSPGGAAVVAYPLSDSLKNTVKKVDKFKIQGSQKGTNAETLRVADEFAKNRTNGDSILAFVRRMQYEYPAMDSKIFIDYLRDNKEEFGFNPDQNKELELPYEDFFPNWGDLALFPYVWKGSMYD